MVFIALVGLVYLYVGEEPFTTIMAGYQERDFTLGQRILTEFRVVVFYLSLIFFPHPSRMNLDHHFLISTSLLTPGGTLLSLAVILWLIGLSVGLAQRQRLLSFCILWYLGNLVIESSVVGLEIAFEHRNYVPSMLVILGGIVLASPFLRIRGIKEVALVFVILLLSFWTYERNWIWGNEIRLWADSAQKSPQKVRPHNNLGTSMFKQGRAREAIVNYSKVLQIDPDHAIAHNNLGFVMARLQRVKSAIMHYSEALRIKPDYKRAYINLSSALRREPHLKRELSSFNSLDLAESLLDRGNALAEMGDINGALEQFSEALRVNPDHQEVHFQKGRLLASQSRIDESIHHFSEALQINPDDAEAHFNMGIALAGKGRLKGAARHFEEALRLNPEDMEARRNLTVLQQTIEASDKAREAESFGVGLRIKPDYKKVQFDLGGPPAKH